MDQPPPIPVLPLEYAPPALNPRHGFLRITAWLTILILVIGAGATFWETESVVISGAALALLGLIMLIGGLARQRRFLWMVGLAHLAIVGLFVGLVNLLHWSPRDARYPFSVMSTLYALVMCVVMSWQLQIIKAARAGDA